MKSPRLLIVTGLPATGKSTLARRLASRYALPLLGKDTIKEALLDALGAADAARSRALSDASFAVLFAVAGELAAAGADILLEGNFRSGAHEALLRALRPALPAAAAAAATCQVLCTLAEPQRRARLAARAGDPARHAGHRDAQWVAAAGTNAGFLELPGERITHDGASPDDAPSLLEALDRWWQGE